MLGGPFLVANLLMDRCQADERYVVLADQALKPPCHLWEIAPVGHVSYGHPLPRICTGQA